MEPARMADSGDGGGRGPAPELAVRGTGPGQITVGGLTAGGGALLVFVSEHCPTSGLALRRLGPLCQGWAQAGLAAIAIFEDPLDVAIRTARRLGWRGQVAVDDPPYPASRAYRVAAVPTTVLIGRDGGLARTVTGWDQPAQAGLLGQGRDRPGAGGGHVRPGRRRRAGGDVRARLDRRPAGDPAHRGARRGDARRPGRR